jgi:hypothetical protein
MARTVRQREIRQRRQAQQAGALGVLGAIAMPIVLFHRVIGEVVGPFRLDFRYLIGYLPWLLMALGIICFIPVALSIGRTPASRLYPRARNAYAGWGITVYLLGLALATQVQQLTLGPSAH